MFHRPRRLARVWLREPANESAEALFQRGVELHRAGDFIRSEQYLSAARDRGYDEGAVVRELIGVCIDGSRYQAALRHALPYLSDHPEDWAT